ncbi:MAG: isochorismatase family cysteine hydrolase [Bryobacteraceae bacterium]
MRTVFFDVDTQMDFLYPAGALSVPGAASVEQAVGTLNRFAASRGWPVISTVDAHAENDIEFREWPAHCVTGTLGQRKPCSTLLEKRVVVPNAPGDLHLEGVGQVLLEKQTFSCFSNVRLPELLRHFDAERYVVYGVVTEICVQFAAMGLLETGRRVEVVTDAVKALDAAKRDAFYAALAAKGGVLTTMGELGA